MKTYARVIAELHDGIWSAWFDDSPHQTCDGGDDWQSAVARLIDIHGSPELEWALISEVEESKTDDHAEFLIPFSVNCQLAVSISLH